MREFQPDIIAWTDGSGAPYDPSTGACRGVGGWGVVILNIHGEKQELNGWEEDATSQRMELIAAIMVFEKTPVVPIELRLDSSYVKSGVNQQWIKRWRLNNWRNSKGQPVSNRDLWERLFRHLDSRPRSSYEFVKVKGHAGVEFNERADRLADAARREGLAHMKNRWVGL